MLLKMRVSEVRDFMSDKRVAGEVVTIVADEQDLDNKTWTKTHVVPDPTKPPLSKVAGTEIVTSQPTREVIDPTAHVSMIISAGELGLFKLGQQVSVELT
jgi:hypothetical protein